MDNGSTGLWPAILDKVYELMNPPSADGDLKITRNDFPPNFVFGTGTSAYQNEGAAAQGGKGPSIWDTFTLNTPGRVVDGSNGNMATDMYTRFKEDIKIMKKMGFDAYRFSISWPRILPRGRCCAGINQEGIDYYNNVIDTLIEHGIEPYVTLFHWDLPQCLQDEYEGFLSKRVVDDFREYAELCFWEFGDRVKHWITLNEPTTYSIQGYAACTFPPSQTPSPTFLSALISSEHQEGKIGITLVTHWLEPLNERDPDDIKAAKRGVDFMLGWFLEPIVSGKYPQSMIDNVPTENLAPFTKSESEMVKGSYDFLGLNYYTANYASNDPEPDCADGYFKDQHIKLHSMLRTTFYI